MEDERFLNLFTVALDTIMSEQDFDFRSQAFNFWLGQNFYGVQDEQECIERICDGPRDQGIDAIFVEAESATIHIVQTKTSDSLQVAGYAIREAEIRTTLDGVRLITSGDYRESVNPRLRNLVAEYHDLLNTGSYTVSVDFFYFKQRPTSNTYEELFQRDFPDIDIRHFDFEAIKRIYDSVRYRPERGPERVTFNALSQIIRKDEPVRSIVVVLSGNDVARVFLEHGAGIFEKNVRFGLPSGSRSINRSIHETAISDEDAPYFWYYNNGITILCKSLTATPNGNFIVVTEPQIINGTQTTYALAQALESGELRDEVTLLAKIIEEREGDNFAQNVTLYTNNQNPIQLRDLSSNDPEQTRIQSEMEGFGYFYERKRGEFKARYDTEVIRIKKFGEDYKQRVVANEKAAQAYLSFFLHRPGTAKDKKSKLFDKSQGLYTEIFNVGTKAEDLLLSYFLLQLIERQRKIFQRQYRELEREGMTEELRQYEQYNYLLYADLALLDLMPDYLTAHGVQFGDLHQKLHLTQQALQDDPDIIEIYHLIREDLAFAVDYIRSSAESQYYHLKFFKTDKLLGSARSVLRTELGRTFVTIQ